MIYGSVEKQGRGRAEAGAEQEDRWRRREEAGVSESLLRLHLRREEAQASSSVQRAEGGSGVGRGSSEGSLGDVGAGSPFEVRRFERQQRSHQDRSARHGSHAVVVEVHVPRQV